MNLFNNSLISTKALQDQLNAMRQKEQNLSGLPQTPTNMPQNPIGGDVKTDPFAQYQDQNTLIFDNNILNKMTPDQRALYLGHIIPQTNPNQQGSGQAAVLSMLQTFTPQQLIARYSNPWFKAAGESEIPYQNTYNQFKTMIGRAPTADEYAQFLPYFQGPGGNVAGLQQLSAYKQQQAQMPGSSDVTAKIYGTGTGTTGTTGATTPATGAAGVSVSPTTSTDTTGTATSPTTTTGTQYTAGTPADQINQIYQQLLSRGASKAEIDHFGQLMVTGQVDPYTVQQFVQQLPEYQNQQDTAFRNSLNTELTNANTAEFGKEKNLVLDQLMRNQGNTNSSALDSAITQLMGNLSQNRTGFLANLSANQYQGNKANAVNDYNSTLGNMYNIANQNRTNAMNNQNYLMQRGYGGIDYQTQMSDMQKMLSGMPQKQPNVFDYLNTGANVAGGIGTLAAAF